MQVPINCWAVVVSAICSVVLGFLWYGPLFGKKWMALSGIVMPAEKPPFSVMIKPMIISIIGALFMAYTLSYSFVFATTYLQITGISAGLQAAFWNWLGFMVPTQLAPIAWERKSWGLFVIHAGYWLVLMAVMGMIIATWR